MSNSPTIRRYDLSFVPDFDAGSFAATSVMYLHSVAPVHALRLHGECTLQSAHVTPFAGAPRVAVAEFSCRGGIVSLSFASPLPRTVVAEQDTPRPYPRVELAFTGSLLHPMCGFYRSQYKTLSGELRYMGVTQFECSDARKAFPCVDEPGVKAVFQIQLTAPAHHSTVVSCMPVQTVERLGDGRRRFTFQPTLPAAPYLLAWVCGEFEVQRGSIVAACEYFSARS